MLDALIDSDGRVPDVVFLPCDAPHAQAADVTTTAADVTDQGEAARTAVQAVLRTVQEWLSDDRFAAARLVVVTRGAVEAGPGEGVRDLAGAAVRGLVRSAQAENPDCFVLLDLDAELPRDLDRDSAPDFLRVALECGEPELAVRNGAVYATRLVKDNADDVLAPPDDTPHWRLGSTGTGTLENVALVPAPGAGEPLTGDRVRVAVRAVGANFRDVLIALGSYPGEAPMGSEGAGVVLEVGPDVTSVAVGDRVMGLFSEGAGPIAVTDGRTLARVPQGWTFAEAAATPIVFLTAYYGLVDLAGLRAGERLLVHSAAGGVGMAALQIARHLGAEVYGTAGLGKWDTLRRLGLDDEHLANSRTTDFETQFLTTTDGHGMDVVLDSLAKEFVDASLRLLPRGGRFLEMGKADVRDRDQVAEQHPGVAYRAFDLMEAGPDRIQEMLTELVSLFEAGALRPLPVTAWDVRRAREAFRYLGQARHMGKVALTLPRGLDPEGTVLITGATGTLGSLLARHLVTHHHTRHLLLTSRSGPHAPGATRLTDELTDLGATVTLTACDTTDHDALAHLIDTIPTNHPLTAVIHTAGTLDDATIDTLTPHQLNTVLTPKTHAAWNLHTLTRHHDLTAFILYSSAAGTLGNPGQANYAAANTFLDALAHHRHTQGLPATSIAWGLWSETSNMTGHLDGTALNRLSRTGVVALSTEEGLALFDEALGLRRPLSVAMGMDLATLGERARAGLLEPLFSGLVQQRAGASAARAASGPVRSVPSGVPLVERLAPLSSEERRNVLARLVRENVAAVLGHATADSIGLEQPFKTLGFDSLSAVELRNRLGAATGHRLSPTLIFDHPTPNALVGHLDELLAPPEADVFGRLLSELDLLQSGSGTAEASPVAVGKVVTRLQDFLLSLEKGSSTTHASEGPSAERISAATDDEIFDLIDNELGIA
ncbi:SDR family NAD(P)-dependent oxidoreductase [Streptomyces sp. sk2.1]|uniref:SDR family NAD(P)-dependent oxidoreductase n=1 Tax=Streptomyces sp. sk2.1 TaxID=2478959 RepID=UPI0011E6A5F4|nr:SDR family NAD(P)-dependent oxidoreductase [Streptomyces sp. sk2.1]TXS74624.1 SDR family NAD(P)-dependent oxidoreductase [Streptomyces sp. sk2.1]